ncbi:hypothetical protein KCU91_g13725, partial [Aureobasidium melanogenum]
MADRVLYVNPTLRQMRDAFEDDGLSALLNCIMEEMDGISSEADATMLLAQVAPEMLKSLLSNTLLADIASGRVIVQPWAEITLKPQHEDNLEPGVYVNFLAPLDGSPLSLYEFSRFIEGLETAVWGSRMLDKTDICRLVESYYAFHSGSSEQFLCSIRGSDLVQDLNNFLSENKARLEDARIENATHMAIPPHCGSARNIHSACKEHYKFKVPALFSLARCVLGALFPDKHFRLFNYCLFRAFKGAHLTSGQSIGCQLTVSYSKYGGFNFPPHEDHDNAESESETETETEEEPEMDESDWMTAFNEKLEDDIKQLELARLELRQKSYTPHFTAINGQELKILDQEVVAHQALKHLAAEEGEKLDRALDDLSSRFTEAGSEAEIQRLTGGLSLGRPSF